MDTLIKLLAASILVIASFADNTEANDDIQTVKRSVDDGDQLRIAAFNIKGFGKAKMKKPDVANHIVSILDRYDVVLIQEVRDKSQSSLTKLWRLLNDTTGDDWGMAKSGRLGKTSRYKEQYVFYYKTERATVVGSYQIPENDLYAREPFSIELEYGSSSEKRIVLMGLHSQPDEAVPELTSLATSIRDVAHVFPDAGGVVAMGDFNADCSYANAEERGALEIFDPNSSEFRSLIPHTADTTSGKTDCAYDRIIVYGSDVMARDAHVYNFEVGLGLDATTAGKVSDHYPVEFTLY